MSGKLKFFAEKLAGYKKFYQIVKTIKMVTMAKYRQTLVRTRTRDWTLRYSQKSFPYAIEEEEAIKAATGTLVYVPITTNRGSCGALNSNMVKYIDEVIGSKTKLLVLGKKGMDSMNKLFPNEMHNFAMMNDMKQAQHFAFASWIWENSQSVEDMERTQVIFTRFVSAGVQRCSTYNFVNYEAWSEQISKTATGDQNPENYLFANALLNQDEEFMKDFYNFHGTLTTLNAVCENELSEYAARIAAVESQLSNIMELQDWATYQYNKTRQGSITAALIEILSAMSAMDGAKKGGVAKNEFWK